MGETAEVNSLKIQGIYVIRVLPLHTSRIINQHFLDWLTEKGKFKLQELSEGIVHVICWIQATVKLERPGVREIPDKARDVGKGKEVITTRRRANTETLRGSRVIASLLLPKAWFWNFLRTTQINLRRRSPQRAGLELASTAREQRSYLGDTVT